MTSLVMNPLNINVDDVDRDNLDDNFGELLSKKINEMQNDKHNKPVGETNNDLNENNIVENPKDEKKFMEFLEDNLSSIISCPISGSTFFVNAIASDGFYYEDSVLKEYLSRSEHKSPITREKISANYYNTKLIPQIIGYAEKYDLEVSKNKFINGDSFEENFEIIQSYISKGEYDNIYKFKNFELAFNGNVNKLFLQNILSYEIKNKDEYIKCIKYVLDNTIDIDFVTNASNNILHIFFRYCREIELIDYLFVIIPNDTIQNMFQLKNNDEYCPIEFSLDNKLHVVNYIFDKYININVSIKMINACITKKLNNETIIKLIEQVENVNVFDDNMSPMFCAIAGSNVDMINYLISRNYDMNMKSPEELNAYHYAAKCRTSTACEYVLEMCDNYEEFESQHGFKIIHIAAYYNTFSVIMFLLEKFVNLTEPITQFRNEAKNYVPINLVELNERLSDEEKQAIIDYMLQLMTLQM